MSTTTTNATKSNIPTRAATTAPSATPVTTSPDARLAEMSESAEREKAGTFEGTKVSSAPKPFNPPPSPRLISDAGVPDPDVKASIRAKNEARIAAYNEAYASYLETMKAAVETAPSLERIACLGAPVSYDALGSLPARERARYDDRLASVSVQNAQVVHDARGRRMFEAEGIVAPGSAKVGANFELNLAGMHAGAEVETDGHETEVELSAGVSVRSSSAQSAWAKMTDTVHEEGEHETGVILDTTINRHGEVEHTIGAKVNGVGGAATFNRDGELEAVTVYGRGAELTVGSDGVSGKIGHEEKIDIAGYEAGVEGAVTFGSHGDDMMIGLEGAAGLEGVAEISGGVEVEVALLSEKAARRAIVGDGFEALMAQRAGGR
jgi:hypothetical protein